MSVTREIIKSQEKDENGQKMLPAVLRSATYISSGGRVYHLFSEEEETSLNTEPFHLDSAVLPVFPSKPQQSAELRMPAPKDTDAFVQTETVSVQHTVDAEPPEEALREFSQQRNDPKVMLKLFEAFSETSHSRLKKNFISETTSTVREKEGTLESECPLLKISSSSVLPFSILDKEDRTAETQTEKKQTEQTPAGFSVVFSDSVSADGTVTDREELPDTCNEETDVKTAAEKLPQHSSISFIRLELHPQGKPKRLFSPRTGAKTKVKPQEVAPTVDVPAAGTKIKPEPLVRFPVYLDKLEQTAAEQVRSLADTLEEQYRQGRKTLSFNSIRLGDGCTTLCLCAARELSNRGYHVLLADAHKQHPELPDLLGLAVDPSLYEIITLIPNRLELLPWSEMFLEFDEQSNGTTRAFADVITSLREEYDMILLDNGCLTDSALVDPVNQWKRMHADGVLLVLNTRRPAPFDIKSFVRNLLLHNVEFVGIAENYV